VKDEDKIGDLGLKETDFLVVMTQVAVTYFINSEATA
jgi:hypothetical protein